MSAFSLDKSHRKLMGWIILAASAISVIFLQIPGVFWFAMIASLSAQLIAKFNGYKINFEIAFGMGFLILISLYLIFLLYWILIKNKMRSWDTYLSLMGIFFIIGFVQQLTVSLFFIWFRNE